MQKKIHIVPKTHLISVFYFNEIEKNTLYKSGEIRHAWIRIFYDWFHCLNQQEFMCISKKSVLPSMENNNIAFKVIFQFSFYFKMAFRKLEIQTK